MKFYEIELNGRTVKFRLTSSDSMLIEKQTGKSIVDYMQDISMTTILTLLKYMVRSSQPTFNDADAGKLYDELIDAGYTLMDVINNIILEALAASGFMSKEELEKIKK